MKRVTTKTMTYRLEASFLRSWRTFGGPALLREHRFDETRRWRFDFAIPSLFIAIEIEGGQWTGGRHTRGLGFANDCEKYNAAARAGWRVFRLTRSMVESPVKHIAQLAEWCKEVAA